MSAPDIRKAIMECEELAPGYIDDMTIADLFPDRLREVSREFNALVDECVLRRVPRPPGTSGPGYYEKL